MSRHELISLMLAWLVLSTVEAGTSDHMYKSGEHVELWVNKVCIYVFIVFTDIHFALDPFLISIHDSFLF